MVENSDLDKISEVLQSPEGQQVFFTLGETFGKTGKLELAVQKAKEKGDANGFFIKLGITGGLILIRVVAQALFDGYNSSRKCLIMHVT